MAYPVSFVSVAAASARRAASGSHVVRLANRWSSGVWAMRLAIGLTAWIGVACAAAMTVAAREDPQMPIGLLVVRALGWLSWVNGVLVAWTLAGELRSSEASQGVTDLMSMRGYAPKALVRGRLVSAALRVAALVGGPGLLLCALAVALSSSLASAPWLLLLALGTLCYALTAGAAVALLVHWSAAIALRHARLLLAAAVFGPCLANRVFSQVPTVPGLFAWLLRGLSAIGVMA